MRSGQHYAAAERRSIGRPTRCEGMSGAVVGTLRILLGEVRAITGKTANQSARLFLLIATRRERS